jgi:hypothetical protein
VQVITAVGLDVGAGQRPGTSATFIGNKNNRALRQRLNVEIDLAAHGCELPRRKTRRQGDKETRRRKTRRQRRAFGEVVETGVSLLVAEGAMSTPSPNVTCQEDVGHRSCKGQIAPGTVPVPNPARSVGDTTSHRNPSPRCPRAVPASLPMLPRHPHSNPLHGATNSVRHTRQPSPASRSAAERQSVRP